MPELPEVEILARHLEARLRNKRIRDLTLFKPRLLRPEPPSVFISRLRDTRFDRVERRGKFLVFHLVRKRTASSGEAPTFLGHLGMTGRFFVQSRRRPLPPHTAAVLELDHGRLVVQDPRGFGRLSTDLRSIAALGPEPLATSFRPESLQSALRGSKQPLKPRLMDQSFVAGIGNIYASEICFEAGLHPARPCNRLTGPQVTRLADSIRAVLVTAIELGSRSTLDFEGAGDGDRLFYFGSAAAAEAPPEERFRVYDREGRPCPGCGSPIRRMVQSARATFFCPRCQRA